MALDLLHQHPARHRGVRRACADAAVGRGESAPHDRLSRDRPARHRAERDRAPDNARRQHLRLGIRADRRARRDRGRLARRLRLRRETRCGAGAAAGAVPQQRVHDDEPGRADHRVRAVRLDHLPAALPPGRQRCQPDPVWPAAVARDGRLADRLDRIRAADHAEWPLQDLPDRRHRRDGGRALPALVDGCRHERRDRLGLHVRARSRARPRDAGARARSPERRPIQRARCRDLGRDAVPLDRWLLRCVRPRRDLREPVDTEPGTGVPGTGEHRRRPFRPVCACTASPGRSRQPTSTRSPTR